MPIPALLVSLVALSGQEGGPVHYGEPEKLFDIADERILESSGIAVGIANEGVIWTHNDSGDSPRLFALDRLGALRAEVALEGAEAVDWEDMASFRLAGVAHLLVADVGDNARHREAYQLYMLAEPQLAAAPPEGPLTAPARTLAFRYPTGSENCAAVAFDPGGGRVLLATRDDHAPRSRVFALPLPGDGATSEALVAEPVAELPLQLVTSMDLAPDGRRAVVITYTTAYFYERGADEPWAAAFGREPRTLSLPMRRQGEGVCFDTDARSLLLSSEKLPSPVLRVPAMAGSGAH